MATGIISEFSSENGDIKSGSLKSDETGDILLFSRQTITCGIGDAVSFTIEVTANNDSIAKDLVCATGNVDHPDSPIRTRVTKDIVVGPEETLTIRGGGEVTGQIIIQGGKLRVVGGGEVTGQVIIQRSGTMVINGGLIKGDIKGEEAELIKITGNGEVTGQIIIHKGHRMVLEDGTINGTLSIDSAYRVVVRSRTRIGC